MKAQLEIGAGNRKRHGGVSLDCNPSTSPDVVHDLNVFPYPFQDSVFDEVYADNVLEHLEDPPAVMTELHRITKPTGTIHIWVPHFRSYWAAIDPTHKHTFTMASMDYFTVGHDFHRDYPYSPATFELLSARLNERWPSPGLRGVVRWVANMWPFFYDYRISHLFPLDEISFRLRPIKG